MALGNAIDICPWALIIIDVLMIGATRLSELLTRSSTLHCDLRYSSCRSFCVTTTAAFSGYFAQPEACLISLSIANLGTLKSLVLFF